MLVVNIEGRIQTTEVYRREVNNYIHDVKTSTQQQVTINSS